MALRIKREKAGKNKPEKTPSRAKRVRIILGLNKSAFWGFELLYKLFGVSLFVPLLYGSFDLMMRLVGYRYLTLENVILLFRHPLFYIWILLLLFLLGVYTVMDVSGVIYIMHCAQMSIKTTTWDTIRFALRNVAAMWKRGNRKMLLNAYLLLPFFCFSQLPELFATYSLPSLMLLGVNNEWKFVAGVLALLAILLVPFIKRLYSFFYFSLENCGYKAANRRSAELGQGKHARDFLTIACVQAACYILYIAVLALGIAAVVVFGRFFRRAYIVSAATVFILKVVLTILVFVYGLLGVLICCVAVSFLYYKHKKEKGEPVFSLGSVQKNRRYIYSEREKAWREKHGRKILAIEALVLIAGVGICSYYVYQGHKGDFYRDIELVKTMEVTAHRGASRFFPENTMAAFQGAVDAGADWIELDIHESKDKQIFVMHDRSFKRTTGVKAFAWELTYDEIARLDAGSFFNRNYEGERIPLLSEAIEFARENNIRLNIELKPSDEEPDLEEKLVELIHEYDFIENCVVTSQVYKAISKVKQLDPEIKTVYVMGLAYGDINRLEYADVFSIRSSSISDALVRRVHNKGKQIYAWTVNTRDAINTMIDRNVDNIITDDVPLAQKCIGRKLTSDTVNDYIDFLNRQLRIASYHLWGR